MTTVSARRPARALGPAVVALGVAMSCGIGGIGGAAPAFAGAPHAQTRFVATTGADGAEPVNDCTRAATPCRTVVHAVDEAAAGDTVSIAKGTYPEWVLISKSLTLTGAGPTATVITGNRNPHDPSIEVLDNGPDVPDVTLEHLGASGNTVAPGVASLGSAVSMVDTAVHGNAVAGVYMLFGTLAMSRSTVDHNSGGEPGLGIYLLQSTAAVDHSTIADNPGGGVAAVDASTLSGATRALLGDVPAPAASLLLTRSTVSGNGSFGVGNNGVATLTADTVSGNTGVGVGDFGGTTQVLDSTVVGTVSSPDSADTFGRGGLLALPASDNARLSSALRRAAGAPQIERLIRAASATARHGARRLAPAAPPPGAASLTVSGSIVAKQDGVPDCSGTITDRGDNLSSDAANSCAFSTAEHDQRKTDPRLGPLADNGGPTRTHLLLKGSPAIDAIPAGRAGCAAGATDQRDAARPQPTGGRCDAGAVELAAKAIVIHPATLPNGTVGKAYAATITATGGAYPTYAWALASGSLPNGLTFTSSGRLRGTPTKAGSFTFTVSVNDPVTRSYTIVIAAPAPPPPPPAPAGNGAAPIAATGPHVGSLLVVGSLAVLLGLLLVLAGAGGRIPGARRSARHLPS